MDQLKSSSEVEPRKAEHIPLPKRTFNIELVVGVFTMVGVAAAGYLAVGLAGLQIGPATRYPIYAKFDNVSGLKYGASVEIAGVPVGEVATIDLADPAARVTLLVDKSVQIRDDDILSIRTKGIIGDRYVKISRGASSVFIPEKGTITETESVVDIEDIIGKIVHSLSGDKDKEGDADTKGGDKDKKSDKAK